MGGVCLNEGCIPTKALLYSAKVLDGIKSAPKYGVSVEGTPAFDMEKSSAGKQNGAEVDGRSENDGKLLRSDYCR